MPQILEIYNSDWPDALAGKAYSMIYKDSPKYLDEYEEKRNLKEFEDLIKKLKKVDGEKDWDQAMTLLAHRVAIEYIKERITGQNLFPGGKMTLMGHARHNTIEMGFLGFLASNLDQGSTEKLFKDFLTIDLAFQKAINTGDTENARKLADPWRIVQITLDESFENLREKLGLSSN
jgi:hypothetical protein